tara:strand:+ start:2861 stop:3775 length:915 start_codon:yes stop_codon:yes gene_type:complete
MKTTNLEYTNIPVLLPAIDYFIDKLKNNEPFHFLRINHGIIDLIHLGYSGVGLSEFEQSFLNNDFESIADKMVKSSTIDVNRPLETYHNQSPLLKQKIIVFLRVLRQYKDISPKLLISSSLGVGLHTYWGVYSHNHPYQLGRTSVWKIIDKHKNDDFYYSGILKHYTIKREIFQLFEELNKLNFAVIFVGTQYLKLYESIFSIKNFYHIDIPNNGAIQFVDEYVSEIKTISSQNENTIVLHSIGHILSFYIAYELVHTNIFGLDIGRSFDLLVKNFMVDNPDIPTCWITLNENELINHVNHIRK